VHMHSQKVQQNHKYTIRASRDNAAGNQGSAVAKEIGEFQRPISITSAITLALTSLTGQSRSY